MKSDKQCNRCHRNLPKTAFGINRAEQDGLHRTCKECLRTDRRRRAIAAGRTPREPAPAVPAGHKWCPGCRQAQPVGNFYPSPSRSDGLGSHCKSCSHDKVRDFQLRQRRAKGVKPPVNSMAPAGTKWCPDCKAYRPRDAFFRNRSETDGLAGYCREHHTERVVSNVEKHHGSKRNYHLKRRYGITEADFNTMYEAQDGLCLGCGKAEAKHVDHDHDTGIVRGLLCFNCNQALGNVRDDVEVLLALVEYLEVFGCNPRMGLLDVEETCSLRDRLAPSRSGSEPQPPTSSPEPEDEQEAS